MAERANFEQRVATLEREVALLKASAPAAATRSVGPGFAEQGQATVLGSDLARTPSNKLSLEARVAKLEQEVGRLRDAEGNRADVAAWRATLGCFKDDPDYEKAIKAGAAWRRRAR